MPLPPCDRLEAESPLSWCQEAAPQKGGLCGLPLPPFIPEKLKQVLGKQPGAGDLGRCGSE